MDEDTGLCGENLGLERIADLYAEIDS